MKIRLVLLTSLTLLVLGLDGCGNLNSVHRTIEVDKGEGALIDIKQRGVFVLHRKGASKGMDLVTKGQEIIVQGEKLAAEGDAKLKDEGKTLVAQGRELVQLGNKFMKENGDLSTGVYGGQNRLVGVAKDQDSRAIVCAEPSPDALSAYASEMAVEGNVAGKGSVKLASALQEGSAFVGLRTQSIQLLRDALYRACEGYMSGALDEDGYDLLMRRYQKFMVALLGIEQLTGSIKAPPVVINTQGRAEAGKDLPELVQQKAKAKEELEETQEEKAKVEKALKDEEAKGSSKDASTIESYTKRIAALGDTIKEKEKNLAAATKGLEESRSTVATGSAAGVVYSVGTSAPSTNSPAQHVASAVKEITLEILKMKDIGELCWSKLKDQARPATGTIGMVCLEMLENAAKAGKLVNAAAEAKIAAMQPGKTITHDTMNVFDTTIQNAQDAQERALLFFSK